MKTSRGFTLIELMIVVAIVAILAAVALPSYNNYVVRSKVTDAFAGMTSYSTAMQQYFQDNRTYGNSTTNGCLSSSTSYFTYSCNNSSLAATTFLIQATSTSASGIGSPAMVYSLDQSGNRATVTVPTGWSLPSPNNCWVRNQSGAC